jgi:putative transposase
VKYAFIESHLVTEFPLRRCCSALSVSRSGYYKWRSGSKKDDSNKGLLQAIEQIHVASRCTYGSPRIHAQLKALGHGVSRGRVERLMRSAGIRSKLKKKFRVTTDSGHSHAISPNLVKREFKVSKPNRVWASDVTFLWTKEGWLYLAVTLDLFSRRIVGWSMGERLDSNLVLKALKAAVQKRGIKKGLIHHSDRGKEYACHAFRSVMRAYGIKQSMSGKGDCWDNAVVESFFHTLKSELTEIYKTKSEAKAKVFEWLEVFYDRRRLHSTLGYVTPAMYEENLKLVS